MRNLCGIFDVNSISLPLISTCTQLHFQASKVSLRGIQVAWLPENANVEFFTLYVKNYFSISLKKIPAGGTC